jgi:purine-nucleoside phosphorylase
MIATKINETITYLNANGIITAQIGIVLGTGLSGLESILDNAISINYGDIPHFPKSTVEGHNSRLIYGTFAGKAIIMMSGRFHFYEGYTMDEITYYIHVLKALGIDEMIITNASGGINPMLTEGEIVLVKDHINLFPFNPLRGWHDDSLGPRFPDLTKAYPIELRQKIKTLVPSIKEAVYLGWQGPSLETPAEYRMAQIIGADIVGMSSIPEVIIAKYRSIPVLLLSIVSNVVDFENAKEATIEDIMQVMHNSGQTMKKMITDYLQNF